MRRTVSTLHDCLYTTLVGLDVVLSTRSQHVARDVLVFIINFTQYGLRDLKLWLILPKDKTTLESWPLGLVFYMVSVWKSPPPYN